MKSDITVSLVFTYKEFILNEEYKHLIVNN